MSKKKFFTQVRIAGQPIALRFTDTEHNEYVLRVGSVGGSMEGLLWLEHIRYRSPSPLLDRAGAAELARALLWFSSLGTLVPKRTIPERE